MFRVLGQWSEEQRFAVLANTLTLKSKSKRVAIRKPTPPDHHGGSRDGVAKHDKKSVQSPPSLIIVPRGNLPRIHDKVQDRQTSNRGGERFISEQRGQHPEESCSVRGMSTGHRSDSDQKDRAPTSDGKRSERDGTEKDEERIGSPRQSAARSLYRDERQPFRSRMIDLRCSRHKVDDNGKWN
jgi:hypothetical protein